MYDNIKFLYFSLCTLDTKSIGSEILIFFKLDMHN